MSKKVKCCECASFLGWALPERVDKDNYEYAKRVFKLASTTGVCGYSMKTKQMAHEQYCKRFEKNKYLEQESEPFKQEMMRLQEEVLMIDLRNTYVLVRTPEENEKLLKEAEKQGFKWHAKNNCEPLPRQHFPDILRFYEDKNVIYKASVNSNCAFYEASELLGTKEMTAREFLKSFLNIRSCQGRSCSKCVLNKSNTKCNKSLCESSNWKNSIDELLEIVASGRTTVLSPEEKAIENIEKLIQEKDHVKMTDEIKDSLKLAIEKLKVVK